MVGEEATYVDLSMFQVLAGMRYAFVAALLGAVFIAWAGAGFRQRSSARPWARSLFVYSILYLTLLFTALAIDRTVA